MRDQEILFADRFDVDCSRDELYFISRGFLVYALRYVLRQNAVNVFYTRKAINRKHLFKQALIAQRLEV